MKTAGIDKDISVDDTIRIVIETKDGSDCPITPYMVESATVYFVSREFTSPQANVYDMRVGDETVASQYRQAKEIVCARRKDSVAAATTGSLTLSGLQVVDGIPLAEGERVLVKDQSNAAKNGIYIVSSSAWTRADDAKSLVQKAYVFVDAGVANIGSGWYLETGGFIAVGTTQLQFVRFSVNGIPASPDEYSETRVAELKRMKSLSDKTSEFYYDRALAVKVFGGVTDPDTSEFFPAWLNPEMVPFELKSDTISENILLQVYEGEDPLLGRFEVEWNPSGCREGDYFVCWSWRPTLSGETLSAHTHFSIGGGVGLTSSMPTHRTNPKKYEMLLERYLPETFKNFLSATDLSPLVFKGINESVASGFTLLENLANQIIDLLDSNATHEQLLPLLSNIFALKIKSSDPTLWRRQIKKAIPNFKKKGTILGLRSAYADAGMKLLRLAKLWQVVSDYTFQEYFRYEDSNQFNLSRTMILPTDSNFGLWFRTAGGSWEDVTEDAASLATFDGSTMVWNDDLLEGESVRVLYKVKAVPALRQTVEDYIRSLPLMDTRDERDQQYPPKNWQVRVIEEDDPMFGVVVPVRHPISDPVVWGRIRTEFPYSENAYNMDEYNGSKRDSIDPCDIDKEFVDACGGCQASVFNIDLEVEGLSDGGFAEALQVAEEYMPFHSMVHTYNLSGSKTEFVGPVEERIETFVTVSGGETMIAGEAQHIFNRCVDSSERDSVKRDILSSFSTVMTGSGTIRNTRVCLFPSVISSESELNDSDYAGLSQGFGAYNINTSSTDENPFESSNLLELLGSSTRYYTLSSIDHTAAEILGEVDSSVVGPLFEYRVSNRIADLTVNISQSKRVVFTDEDADFHLLGLVSQRDVDNDISDESVWTLIFGGFDYKILDLLPDGSLLLEEIGSNSDSDSGWKLFKGAVNKGQGIGGSRSVQHLGLVGVVSPPTDGVRSVVRMGDYIYMGWPTSVVRYKVRSYKAESDLFYIEGYEGGGIGGADVKVYRRAIETRIGRVGYDGLALDADGDLESALPVSNGESADLNSVDAEYIRENYLLFIGSEYYTILHIDGSNLVLGGRLDSYTKSGTGVSFAMYKFSKQSLSLAARIEPPIPAFEFDSVDRSGKALMGVSRAVPDLNLLSLALNSAKSDQPLDVATQEEQIEFTVEYRDGEE